MRLAIGIVLMLIVTLILLELLAKVLDLEFLSGELLFRLLFRLNLILPFCFVFELVEFLLYLRIGSNVLFRCCNYILL